MPQEPLDHWLEVNNTSPQQYVKTYNANPASRVDTTVSTEKQMMTKHDSVTYAKASGGSLGSKPTL